VVKLFHSALLVYNNVFYTLTSFKKTSKMTNDVSLRKRNKENGTTESRKTKSKKSTKNEVVVETSKTSQNLVDRVRELLDDNCDDEKEKILRQKIKDKLSNSISRLGVNINNSKVIIISNIKFLY
jgi:hypothetical protein